MHHITLHTAFIFSLFFSSFILSTIHQLTCGLFCVLYFLPFALPASSIVLFICLMYVFIILHQHSFDVQLYLLIWSLFYRIFFFFFLTQFFFHYTNKKYGSNKCLDGGISRKMWSMAHFWF